MTFLKAVARQEGFYVEGSRSSRNHNPGDIEAGRFATAHGAVDSDGRFAVFPDEETGFAAMKALFQTNGYRGLTVADGLSRWAPPTENHTSLYVVNVCYWAACKPTDLITDLLEAA